MLKQLLQTMHSTREQLRLKRAGSRGSSSAFVLPMTLVVLAACAVALTAACRASLHQATRAAHDADELQARWAALSCDSTLLPMAQAVLDRAPRGQRGDPAVTARATLRLGGCEVRLVLADEQAKANVGMLLRVRGRAQGEQTLRDLVRRTGVPLAVDLRPMRVRTTRTGPGARDVLTVGSFGQVFAEPAAEPEALLGASSLFTCWGDGRLNVRHAPTEAIAALCAPPLSAQAIRQVLDARAANGDEALTAALRAVAAAPSPTTPALAARLTEESSCHSLWVITRPSGAAGRSARYTFFVREAVAGRDPRTLTYAW